MKLLWQVLARQKPDHRFYPLKPYRESPILRHDFPFCFSSDYPRPAIVEGGPIIQFFWLRLMKWGFIRPTNHFVYVKIISLSWKRSRREKRKKITKAWAITNQEDDVTSAVVATRHTGVALPKHKPAVRTVEETVRRLKAYFLNESAAYVYRGDRYVDKYSKNTLCNSHTKEFEWYKTGSIT